VSTFDPMDAAINWLNAYRAHSPLIVNLYAEDAILECGCGRQIVLVGRTAIANYWWQCFVEKSAGALEDLQPHGGGIVVSYRVPDGIVQAILHFDESGKIKHSRCGPTAEIVPLRKAC
jgi:hypothetical protein